MSTPNWVRDGIFYHIYPIGFCGAPAKNPWEAPQTDPKKGILKLLDWVDHLKSMKVSCLYLGPVFQSTAHGYDTADYRLIDSRLGTNDDFKKVCDTLHANGIRVVLDGVFNHVGRDFWAFLDLKEKQRDSKYAGWFNGVDFNRRSPDGDPFCYDSWQGHFNLVKLNLRNPEVSQHLLDAVGMWIEEFGIDGLRLDAADCVDPEFFKQLKSYTASKRQDFWLMGEIIHGDYRVWANHNMLDSVTNYECHKGIFSSHNTKNYFEIGYSLNRQFGNGGIYKDLDLYTFVDNHDVNRLASCLSNQAHLQNCYTIMYTMPGVPSIYYGSEWGLKGARSQHSDDVLRPCLDLDSIPEPNEKLLAHIQRLGAVHEDLPALRMGNYEQVVIRNEQLVYKRSCSEQTVYCAFNLDDKPCTLEFQCGGNTLADHLNEPGETFPVNGGKSSVTIPACGALILTEEKSSGDKTSGSGTVNMAAAQQHTAPAPAPQCVQRQVVVGGKYHHFKGRDYVVLQVGRHSETLEELVVYQELSDQKHVWMRPTAMFLEDVNDFGNIKPRFDYVGRM